ncbi:MAG: cobalamin B12-binding domain-containing protein [Betaproteobacteria bacterium]|nr:cobalamin B12-binding domain-containing protein [Betaproteobacteria bacterium]
MASIKEIFEKLNDAVLWGEEGEAAKRAQEALDVGASPKDIIKDGMSPGVQEAGNKFNEGEFFLPELMLAGEAMKAGIAVVMPALLAEVAKHGTKAVAKIMMGTVEGDVHDIGKNICLAMLTAEGFECVDLGVDNEIDKIVAKVKEVKPDILGLGSYMTTTMVQIPPAIEKLRELGLTQSMVILSGGVAVNRRWSRDVAKSNGYGDDAWEMIALCKEIIKHPPEKRVEAAENFAFSDLEFKHAAQS